jgi:hypothetical protein
MTTYYLNGSAQGGQTANGSGQVVPETYQASGNPNLNPYQTIVCSMTGTTASATVQIEGSNDGVNWVNIGTALSAVSTGPVSVVQNTTYAFFRAVVSAITGTGAAVTTTLSM